MENILTNFKKFFIVGCIAFSTDISLYFLFLEIGFISTFSKGLSFICGLLVGYFLNSFFTFNQPKISSIKFYKYILVYFVSLLANITVNERAVIYLKDIIWDEFIFLGAVICATVVSLLMNFFGLRNYVFKD
tara:strand:- start:60 stop:455 length:396 start_codon:yes stop_codon:yes gene_type:complete